MLEEGSPQHRKHGALLYCAAFAVFAVLLALRESTDYVHIYDVVPVMGRTIPYVVLTILLTIAYKLNGNQMKDIGWRWPHWNYSKPKVLGLIVLVALLILVVRIAVTIPTTLFVEYLGLPPRGTGQAGLLSGNLPLLLTLLPVMWLAVVSEEVLIRGFLMNALANMFGKTRKGWMFAIVLSSIVFGLGHFPQGPGGIIGATMGGLIYGMAYYFAGRTFWPAVGAHAVINTLGFIATFLNT